MASVVSARFYVDVLAEPEVAVLAKKLLDDVVSAKAASQAHGFGYIVDAQAELLRDWFDYSQAAYIDQLRRQYGLKALVRVAQRPELDKPDLQAIIRAQSAAKEAVGDQTSTPSEPSISTPYRPQGQ